MYAMFLRMDVIKNTVPFKKVFRFSLSSYSNFRNFFRQKSYDKRNKNSSDRLRSWSPF